MPDNRINQTLLSAFTDDSLTTPTTGHLTHQPKKLTKAVLRTLEMLRSGLSQATVSRLQNRSRATITNHVKILIAQGYAIRNPKTKILTFLGWGSSANPDSKLGGRKLSIGYKLPRDFELKGEQRELKNGTIYQHTFIQGFHIEKTAGRKGKVTLVISPPWIVGDDAYKMQFQQIERCKTMLNKLNNWYDLRIDADTWYMVSEMEFDHKYMKKEAELMYSRVGKVAVAQAKLDDSLKNGGEFQTFGVDETRNFMGMPRKIDELERQILDQKQTIDRLSDAVGELVRQLTRVPEPPGDMTR